jgi:hypothetical protein
MEAVSSSETLLTIYKTSWRHIPEDSDSLSCDVLDYERNPFEVQKKCIIS